MGFTPAYAQSGLVKSHAGMLWLVANSKLQSCAANITITPALPIGQGSWDNCAGTASQVFVQVAELKWVWFW